MSIRFSWMCKPTERAVGHQSWNNVNAYNRRSAIRDVSAGKPVAHKYGRGIGEYDVADCLDRQLTKWLGCGETVVDSGDPKRSRARDQDVVCPCAKRKWAIGCPRISERVSPRRRSRARHRAD